MAETLSGLGMLIVGFLIAIFSGPLAKISNGLNRRMWGFEFPFLWCRAVTVIIGALLSFSGLLTLLRLPLI
jgi:hypothetical protein